MIVGDKVRVVNYEDSPEFTYVNGKVGVIRDTDSSLFEVDMGFAPSGMPGCNWLFTEDELEPVK